MSHRDVDTFIGQTMESDFHNLGRATDILRRLVDEARGDFDETLGCYIGKVGDFLTSRAHNHFRLEERIGACTCIAELQPGLDGSLLKVTADYRSLDKMIAEIKKAVEAVNMTHPEAFDVLERKLIVFKAMLEAHAEKENLFVFDAYNQELGQLD